MSVANLIILGPQGSGKTTQAELLAKTYGFVLFSAGDVLREIAQQDTDLGQRVRQTVNVEGRLVEPELISQVIKERVATVPKDRGVILDGYPRSLIQYELFKKFWAEMERGDYKVIDIDLSEAEAIKRLTNRVTCENCGAVCAEGTVEKCTRCRGRLVKRPDDTPAAIQSRLQSFYSETMPMIRVMQAEGKVLLIDGAAPIGEVHQKIVENL